MIFFEHKDCDHYPCHMDLKRINCLFCYCPLYQYEDCGGDYGFTDKGIKDCSDCKLPHTKKGYVDIVNFIKEKNTIRRSG